MITCVCRLWCIFADANGKKSSLDNRRLHSTAIDDDRFCDESLMTHAICWRWTDTFKHLPCDPRHAALLRSKPSQPTSLAVINTDTCTTLQFNSNVGLTVKTLSPHDDSYSLNQRVPYLGYYTVLSISSNRFGWNFSTYSRLHSLPTFKHR